MRNWSLSFITLWLSTLTACSHSGSTNVEHPPAALAVLGVSDASAKRPALIEIRVLVVAYQGAQGSDAQQQRTRAQALERARMLSSMARTGEHIAELVPKYSDRRGAAEDMGLFKVRPEQPEPFGAALIDAALAVAPGHVSEPVATPEGYVLIERLNDPPTGPERIAARHILISYAGSAKAVAGATRSEVEARALAEQILKQARQPGADWKALAAQYTDEPGGKATGGDLGKFGRHQMVPAFETAAFALSVGEISDVVHTPFGFHVIQRYE
jgi:peptidyl-prolyl cis-trans isomerase SurA